MKKLLLLFLLLSGSSFFLLANPIPDSWEQGHSSQQQYLRSVDRYLANPYVALLPAGMSLTALAGEESINMLDLRGNADFAQPDAISICGTPDTIPLMLFTKSVDPIFDTELTLNFDGGLEFSGFAYVSSGNAVLDTINVDNPGSPVFRIDEISLATGSVVVYVGVQAGCDFNSLTNPGVSFTLDYVSGGVACTTELSPEAGYAAGVVQPQVAFSSAASNVDLTDATGTFCSSVNITQTTANTAAQSAIVTLTTPGDTVGITLADVQVAGTPVPVTDITDNGDGTVTIILDNEANPAYFGADGLTSGENVALSFCYVAPGSCFDPVTVEASIVSACQGELCGAGEPDTDNFTLTNAFNFDAEWDVSEVRVLQQPAACGLDGDPDSYIIEFDLGSVFGDFRADLFDLVISIDSCVSLTPDTMYLAGTNPGPLSGDIAISDGRTTLVLNNAGITTDPDGAGVGLEDLDGDGNFDDLPGDQGITVVIEFSAEVGEGCGGTVTPPICNFTDVILTGKVDCGRDNQTFEGVFPPGNNFPPSEANTTGDLSSYVRDGVTIEDAFDFGGVGVGPGATATSSNLSIQHNYNLSPTDVSCASVLNRFVEIQFSAESNKAPVRDATLAITSGATLLSTTFSSDTLVVTWLLDVTDNIVNMNTIDLTINMDSTLCGPPMYGTIDIFTFDECVGCDGSKVFRACTSNPYRIDYDDNDCTGCNTEALITLTRVTTGYTDRDLATPVTQEEAAAVNTGFSAPDGSGATTLQVLPGDTVAMNMKVVVTDPAVWNDSDLWRFSMTSTGASLTNSTSLLDYLTARLMDFSVLRTDGSVIDLGGVDDGQPGLVNNSFLLGNFGGARTNASTDIHPGLSHTDWQFSQSDISNDTRDARALILQVSNSFNTPLERKLLDNIYALLGGELLVGDTISFTYWVPVVRTPRTSGYNDTDVPISNYTTETISYFPQVASNRMSGPNKAFIVSDQCASVTSYKFYEPTPKSDVRIEYTDDNGEGCDAQIVIDYTVDENDIATLMGDGAFASEYRPILGVEQFTAEIPSSYYLDAAEVTYELLNTPFSGSVTIDQTTSDAVTTSGSTFLHSGAGSTTITFRDAELDDGTNWLDNENEIAQGEIDVTQIGAELPLLGVGGAAYADPDTLRIIIPLKRICPVDPTAPLTLNSTLDYPYLPDYSNDAYRCGTTNRRFETIAGECPGEYSYNFDRGTDGNPHRFGLESDYATLNEPDLYVAPTTSLSDPTLMDSAPGSESNTYTFTANSDLGPGKLLIEVDNAIDLIGITGSATSFTQLTGDATSTTYEVDMGTLNSGNIFTIDLETELLFCEVANVRITPITGCVTDESSAIAALGGISCPGPSDTYSYLAGETGLALSLDYAGSQVGCGPETYTLEYENTGTSALFDFAPTIYLPEGLNLVANSFTVSAMGVTNEVIDDPTENMALSGVNGTAFSWPADYFDNATFGTDEVAVGETVTITFMAEATCDFTSGGAISTELSASNVCGEPSTTDVATGVAINTVPPGTALPEFDIQLSDNRVSCEPLAEPLTLTLLNTSGTISQTELCFTLPAGVTITAADVEVIAPLGYVPVIGSPVPVGTGGASQLCFDGPMNLEIGQFICLNLTPQVTLDCGAVEIGLDVTSAVSITCGGATCEVAAAGMSSNFALEVVAPLAVAEANLVANCTASADMLDIAVEAALESITADDFTGNVNVSLFKDIDGDGELDDFDTAIGGPTSVPLMVASGEMGTIAANFTVAAADACPLLLQVSIPGCACSELIIPFDEVSTPLAEELGEFLTLCPGEPYTIDAEICGDVSLVFDPISAGTVMANGSSFDIVLNDGFGTDGEFVTLILTTSIGNCGGNADTIYVSQLETFEFEDVAVTVCNEGCQTVDLGIDPALQDGLEVAITPSLFITDPTSLDPEICDPVSSLDYDVAFTLNGQCVTNATLAVTVVESPTLTITAGTGCQTGFDLAGFIAVSPADLGATLSTSGTGTFAPSNLLSDNPRYTPSPEDIEAGEVMITVRTDNPEGPCAGLVARETFTILLVDCGTFPWGGER